MIRPFTCLCLLLAGGSGLYLFQSKHRVQVLDREIEGVVRATEAARARSGVLKAEWTLMSDPERLAGLAEKFLPLKTTTPGQFTTMADLDSRLPAIRPPEQPRDAGTDEDATVQAEAPRPDPAKVAAQHPAPASAAPAPNAAPVPAPVAVAAKAAPAPKPRPVQVAAQAPSPAPAPAVTQVVATALGRPAAYASPAPYAPSPALAPRATPISAPAAAPPAQAGSSLGMARNLTPLPYRPGE